MCIYIRSMSEAQSRIYDSITSKVTSINTHMAKLMLFKDTEYVNHWESEIYAFLHDVNKLKGTNKYPKQKFILKCLSVGNDSAEKYLEMARAEEEEIQPAQVSSAAYLHALKQYQEWISAELSSKGYVTPKEVRSVLENLI